MTSMPPSGAPAFRKPRRSTLHPFIPDWVVVVVIVVLCAGKLLLGMLSGGGPTAKMRIVLNLRRIELMKENWASEHSVTGSVRISEQDLAPYAYGFSSNGSVTPVIGERYIIHRLDVAPEAQLTRAYGKLPAGTVIRLTTDTNRGYRIFLPNEQGRASSM
jgi:hypothetical protein